MHLWLVCKKQNKKVVLFSALGALFNFITNLLLIPTWGINGAAMATLITQILTNFVFPLLIPSTRPYSLAVIDALCLRNIEIKELIRRVIPGRK